MQLMTVIGLPEPFVFLSPLASREQTSKKGRSTMRKWSVVIPLFVFALFMSTAPAQAHQLQGLQSTANCSGYTLTFTSIDLTTTDNYTISWTITGLGPDITGSINFSNVSGTVTNTGSGTFSPALEGGPFTPSVTATFVDNTDGETNTLSNA